MHILPLTPGPVGQVLYNLRAADRREIEATVACFDSEALAAIACACRLGFVAAADDMTPVAVLAAGELWPGVWQLGMFATPRWPEVGRGVTRFARSWLARELGALGAHRAQAFSLAEHEQAHRWMLRLGGRCEATLRAWGRGGEDFKLFVWLNRRNDPCAS